MTREIISSFFGNYSFLSNFYYRAISYKGFEYRTNEHAFQAAKTNDPLDKAAIRDAETPGAAKRLGRKVNLQPYWNECIRYEVMWELLKRKFSYPDLLAKLQATGDAILIEGNHWGDTTWGMSRSQHGTLEGHNILGWMLMRLRHEQNG